MTKTRHIKECCHFFLHSSILLLFKILYLHKPKSISAPIKSKNLFSHVDKSKHFHLRYRSNALAAVAQWIERQPVNQRVTGSIPSQGTCLGCRPRGKPSMFLSHIDVLYLFLSPFHSL